MELSAQTADVFDVNAFGFAQLQYMCYSRSHPQPSFPLLTCSLCLSASKMYSFTLFAMQLNELDKEIEEAIPKTDCRLRPDIRAMENGDIGRLLLVYKAFNWPLVFHLFWLFDTLEN